MFCRSLCLVALLLVSGCVSFVASYDPTFDQSLNKLSEDTAKFVAAAGAGGEERLYRSQETVAYYATTYNVLDRLIERARLTRSSFPCSTNPSLETFAASPTSSTRLPADHLQFDCREFQLYGVRFYANQLEYAHRVDGTLNRAEGNGARPDASRSDNGRDRDVRRQQAGRIGDRLGADTITAEIIAAATAIGGETWNKIRKSTPIFVRAYAQALVDIAAGVALGPKEGISKSDAKMYLQNARLLLIMAIANTSHIILVQVQKFIDKALGMAKTAINNTLPIAIL